MKSKYFTFNFITDRAAILGFYLTYSATDGMLVQYKSENDDFLKI